MAYLSAVSTHHYHFPALFFHKLHLSRKQKFERKRNGSNSNQFGHQKKITACKGKILEEEVLWKTFLPLKNENNLLYLSQTKIKAA
jgi:hypothetical protein